MTQSEHTFNPNEHLMQIKSRNGNNDYLPVAWRLVWFRSMCPDGTIETEMVHLDMDRETEEETSVWNSETRRSEKVIKRAPGFVVFRAVVKDGKGGMATGTKSEKAASFGDFIEKGETGAIGRALAALGYGTQFTGDELDEGHRIVDSPVGNQATSSTETSAGAEKSATNTEPAALPEMRKHIAERAKAKGLSKEEYEQMIYKALGSAKTFGQWDINDIAKLNVALNGYKKTELKQPA